MRTYLPIAILLLAAAGVAILFLFDDGVQVGPASADLEVATEPEVVDGSLDRLETSRERVERVEAVGSDEGGEGSSNFLESMPARDTALVVRGRVVDTLGNPIAGAEVSVESRVSFQALRDSFTGARGAFRGARGPGQEQRNAFGAMFRMERLGDERFRTGPDGTFEVRGTTFSDASLELSVAHPDFAASEVRREWGEDQGELELGDVVLAVGGTIRGRVVEQTAAGVVGVAGATVRFRPSGGFDPFGGPRRPGGRRGGGPDDEDGEEAGWTTDPTGGFEIHHVASAEGQLEVDAERFEVLRSSRLAIRDGETTDAGELVLDPAAVLRGRVLDATGEGVAGARVRVMQSREEQEQEQAGRGRRQRGGRGFPREQVRTEDDGTFAVDHLPLDEALRVEIRHRNYLDGTVDPIPAGGAGGEVVVRLVERLSIVGQVVDATTGEPIEQFGVSARPSRLADMERQMRIAGGAGRGPRGARGGRDFGGFVTEIQRQRELLTERLGGVGEIPGPTPEPTIHPDGRFELDDLEDGVTVFDVDAPGYVKIAAGPVELVRGAKAPPVTIKLERGVELVGTVRDGASGEPIAGATIELRVADPGREEYSNDADPRAWMTRAFSRGLVVARADSDAAGDFSLPPQRPGAFDVRVSRRGYADLELTGQELGRGRSPAIEVELLRGASVSGSVIGLEPGARARVRFTKAEGFGRRTADVTETGTYSIDEIEPGGWYVQVETVGEDGRPNRGRELLRRLSQSEPDLVVPELGGEITFDVQANSAGTGTVEGRVFVSGGAVEGMRVQLTPVVGAVADLAESFGRRARGRIAGVLSSEVEPDGSFKVREVPPGLWRVEVTSGGRRGGGGPLASQEFQIDAGSVIRAQFDVALTSLLLELRTAGDAAVDRARLTLMPALLANPLDPATWEGLPELSRRLQAGENRLDDLPAGEWVYRVRAQGYQEVTGSIVIVPGGATLSVDLQPSTNDGGN